LRRRAAQKIILKIKETKWNHRLATPDEQQKETPTLPADSGRFRPIRRIRRSPQPIPFRKNDLIWKWKSPTQ